MKYCHSCHRTTPGKPPYCGFCASSFNVRLCPRHHISPRSAQACSQCGSRDLSTPQPKVPLLLRPLLFLLSLTPGIILLASLIVFIWFFVARIITDPQNLGGLMAIGLLLGTLFAIWIMLPKFLRRFIKNTLSHFSSKDRGER